MVKNKVKEIQHHVKAKTIYLISALCLEIISFYFCISNAGFVTHDELQSYVALHNRPLNFEWLPRLGSMLLIPNTFANYLQFNVDSVEIYRLYTLCGILLALLAASKFVNHFISKDFGLPFAVLFFAFLQIGYIHNGAISFSWLYQYSIAIVFLCLDQYLYYCETNRKGHYIFSAVLFLVSIMFYEAYYMFSIILFFFAFIYLCREKKLSIRNLIEHLWLPASFGIVYLILYYMNLNQLDYAYEGIMLDSTHDVWDKIRTTFIYSFGMFPLRLNGITFFNFLSCLGRLTYENLFLICKGIVAAAAIFICIPYGEKLSYRKYVFLISSAGLCILLPCVLYGMSKQYLFWADNGIILYGGSYYSYFFIIIVLLLLSNLIYKAIRYKKIRTLFRSIIFVSIFAISFVTDINNKATADSLDKNDDKYVLFDRVIKSDYFMENIVDDAQIYAPEMVGIHLNLKTLDNYVKEYTDKKVTFYNQEIDIDYKEPIYMLKYDAENSIMMFGRICDSTFTADEVYINSMNDLGGYSLCGIKGSYGDRSNVLIDEKVIGMFGTDFMIPLQSYVNSNVAKLNGKDIVFDNLKVVCDSVIENSLIQCIYGSGIHQQEEFGRWMAKNSEFIIENRDPDTTKAVLQLNIATATGEEGKIQICAGNDVAEYIIDGNTTEIIYEVPLYMGTNKITLISFLESLKVDNGDMRDINLKLQDGRCIVDGSIVDFK